jgi:hypothetical protein
MCDYGGSEEICDNLFNVQLSHTEDDDSDSDLDDYAV